MLSLIQNEVVVQHAWMSNAEFADIVAVSQMTPGPIAINSATYVGLYRRRRRPARDAWCGILGSALATFAVCLPSLTLMLLHHALLPSPEAKGPHTSKAPWQGHEARGHRHDRRGRAAADVPAQQSARRTELHRRLELGCCSAAVFVASVKKVNPILLICLSAAAGILIYYVF